MEESKISIIFAVDLDIIIFLLCYQNRKYSSVSSFVSRFFHLAPGKHQPHIVAYVGVRAHTQAPHVI